MTTPSEPDPWAEYDPQYPGVLNHISDPDNALFVLVPDESPENPYDDGPLDTNGLTDAEFDALFKSPAAEAPVALTAAGFSLEVDTDLAVAAQAEFQSRMDPDLQRYWLHGEGAAKIRWGTEGSFTRCVRELRKYIKVGTEGACANLYHEATGHWPGEKRRK